MFLVSLFSEVTSQTGTDQYMVTGQTAIGQYGNRTDKYWSQCGNMTYNLGQAQVSVVIGQNGTDKGNTVFTGQLLVTVW